MKEKLDKIIEEFNGEIPFTPEEEKRKKVADIILLIAQITFAAGLIIFYVSAHVISENKVPSIIRKPDYTPMYVGAAITAVGIIIAIIYERVAPKQKYKKKKRSYFEVVLEVLSFIYTDINTL